MSTAAHRRRAPLVYAGPRAIQDARTLLGPNVVLENEVAHAIEAGSVVYGGAPKVFDPDGRWVAHVRRRPGHVRPRPRAWHVLAIEPQQKEEPCN